ncbi:MAG: NUDIX domain-containing protein [Candidatus Altiarchaeia archaeon]|jgi:nucleoside triphosphatase
MTDQRFPEPTVGALIFNSEGKMFLMKSHKWHDTYVIPGGHIELGETAEEALAREIKEETALDIYDIEFLCIQEFIYDNAFWKKRHFIFLDYACKTKTTNVVLNSEGHDHIWVTLDETKDSNVDLYTRNAITKYLEKHGKRPAE